MRTARPTFEFAENYPAPTTTVALGRGYDLLIHLHDTSPAQLLP
ncbi:hypothetical protein [Flindersiella endophytica]